MNADDSPTPRDDAVDRFAAAVDGQPVDEGAADGSAGAEGDLDPDLARELEIVNRLRAQGAALDPDPEERARARRRLLAALADEMPRVASGGPSRAS